MIVSFIYSFTIRIKPGSSETWTTSSWRSARFDLCLLYKYVENAEGIALLLCFTKHRHLLIDEHQVSTERERLVISQRLTACFWKGYRRFPNSEKQNTESETLYHLKKKHTNLKIDVIGYWVTTAWRYLTHLKPDWSREFLVSPEYISCDIRNAM